MSFFNIISILKLFSEGKKSKEGVNCSVVRQIHIQSLYSKILMINVSLILNEFDDHLDIRDSTKIEQ